MSTTCLFGGLLPLGLLISANGDRVSVMEGGQGLCGATFVCHTPRQWDLH